MNQETILGNAINCWFAEPQAQLKPAPILNDPLTETYPDCLFSTDVKKGEWTFGGESKDEIAVTLDKDWPQYSKEVLDQKDYLKYYEWPENFRGNS